MRQGLTLLNIVLLIITIQTFFYYRTLYYETEKLIGSLSAQIASYKQEVSTLSAELAHISSPQNLSMLAKKFLKLQRAQPNQIKGSFKDAIQSLQ